MRLTREMLDYLFEMNRHHYIDEAEIHESDQGMVMTIHYDDGELNVSRWHA